MAKLDLIPVCTARSGCVELAPTNVRAKQTANLKELLLLSTREASIYASSIGARTNRNMTSRRRLEDKQTSRRARDDRGSDRRQQVWSVMHARC